VFTYPREEATAVTVEAVHCDGEEATLSACQVRGAAGAECEPGVGLVGVSCGPFVHAGPEVCFVGESGVRQCWNADGYGTAATMVCGTAGRRPRRI
jgi:hypothetical protein